MKKAGLKGIVKGFFGDYNAINTTDILHMQKCLMKET